jgi:hypothetical protein
MAFEKVTTTGDMAKNIKERPNHCFRGLLGGSLDKIEQRGIEVNYSECVSSGC